MSESAKKKVLSQTLEDIRRRVEKTEAEPVEGVTADAVDAAEARAALFRLAKKVAPSKAPTTPLNKIPKDKKLARLLKPLARRLPPAELAALTYETAALINSEEAREKAREQANAMQERGYSAEGMGKNALQGLLDPVGTIYAAGDALVDLTKTSAGNLVDKYFGP